MQTADPNAIVNLTPAEAIEKAITAKAFQEILTRNRLTVERFLWNFSAHRKSNRSHYKICVDFEPGDGKMEMLIPKLRKKRRDKSSKVLNMDDVTFTITDEEEENFYRQKKVFKPKLPINRYTIMDVFEGFTDSLLRFVHV